MTEEQLSRRQSKQKDLGSQGEDYVLHYERQRLAEQAQRPAVPPRPAEQVQRPAGQPPHPCEVAIVGRHDVGIGYDIASCENPASTVHDRFIEVKTFAGTPTSSYRKSSGQPPQRSAITTTSTS